VLLCALWGRPWTQAGWAVPILAVGFARWPVAVVAAGARREEVPRGPRREVDYFEPLRDFLFRLPDQRRHRDPVHALALGGRRDRASTSRSRAGGCASSTLASTRSSTRAAERDHLRELAVRQRRALRRARERQADKSSYGERALIEKGLPYLRLRWKSDDWRVYEVLLPRPLLFSQGDARMSLDQFQSDELLIDVKKPRRGDRQGALDAVLVRVARLRGTVRRLDEGDRQAGRLRAHVDTLRSRTARLAGPSLSTIPRLAGKLR
jgi:hypothetical protein